MSISLTGSLNNLFKVYAGPTQGGIEQVIVEMKTDDPDGEGLARWALDIEPDTSARRRVAIAHELALGLLAHELLEQLVADGESVFDPHEGGRLVCSPPLSPHLRAEGHCGVTLCRSAAQSHTGAQRWDNAPIEQGVAEIVRRLNHPVFGDPGFTVASCDGHGAAGVCITLASGESLGVIDLESHAEKVMGAS